MTAGAVSMVVCVMYELMCHQGPLFCSAGGVEKQHHFQFISWLVWNNFVLFPFHLVGSLCPVFLLVFLYWKKKLLNQDIQKQDSPDEKYSKLFFLNNEEIYVDFHGYFYVFYHKKFKPNQNNA